jgi:hypothetical protein
VQRPLEGDVVVVVHLSSLADRDHETLA